MTIAIHQPNFVPWIGYFYKIIKSDTFVLLDDVQYTKNGYINRNQIKSPNGALWLTMPVNSSGQFGININQALIDKYEKNIEKIIKTVEGNYKKADHYKEFAPGFFEIISKSGNNLSAINIALIKWINAILEITTPLTLSSEMTIEGKSTERLVNICKTLNGHKYLSGFGAKKYQEPEVFEKEQIELAYTDFKHPVYRQLWGEFLPNMSIIDLVFNCGSESRSIIEKSQL